MLSVATVHSLYCGSNFGHCTRGKHKILTGNSVKVGVSNLITRKGRAQKLSAEQKLLVSLSSADQLTNLTVYGWILISFMRRATFSCVSNILVREKTSNEA